MIKAKKKVFPMRFSDELHAKIEAELERSVIKSKHAYVIQAVEEKLERDAMKKEG